MFRFNFERNSMQLVALEEGIPVSAPNAEKGKNYLCPECGAPVRARGGPSRQSHFFHLAQSSSCRQSEKSWEHVHLQLRLSMLTGGEMEAPFPAIGRIADVAWHQRKIVFEVQCSPISLEEAEQRTADYRSAGYEAIWILHEKRFNRKNLSAAEDFLRKRTCYFSNVNDKGSGIVYDQFEALKGGRRLFKGPALPINPVRLFPLPKVSSELPEAARQRLGAWSHYAEGDLLSRLLKEPASLKNMIGIEQALLRNEAPPCLPFKKLLIGAYRSLLEFLLQKAR